MTGNAPTLKTVMLAYPKQNSVYDWLNSYLVDLAIFDGKTASAVAYQIDSIAHSIMEKYHYLKLTELMLFFSMFKAGELIDRNGEDTGKMYGTFSGKAIMSALRIFVLNHRNQIIYEEEQKKNQNNADVDYTKYLQFVQTKKDEAQNNQAVINEHNKQFLQSLNTQKK